MYLINLYREIRTWQKVKKVAKEYEASLDQAGFRVDWIGRIYTVINLPEEVLSHHPSVQEGFVLQKLRDYDQYFLGLGIADVIIPEFERIDGAGAFLLVLSPERRYFKILPFLGFLLKTTLLVILIRILYNLFTTYNTQIVEIWEKIVNWIL